MPQRKHELVTEPRHHAALDRIAFAHQLTEHAHEYLIATVNDGRHHGLTWREIGHAIGLRPTAAQKRFGPLIEPANNDGSE
jgi:hypothetical protein